MENGRCNGVLDKYVGGKNKHLVYFPPVGGNQHKNVLQTGRMFCMLG